MKHRLAVPEPVAVRLLVANQRACCICHERKQVIIHHIDGDPSNYNDDNLAVLCLDCHSHVTGNEGFGRAYTQAEVTAHKRAWEQRCAGNPLGDEDDQEPHGPVPVLYETVLLLSAEEVPYEFDLDEGDELAISVLASGYLGLMICDPEDYDDWRDGKDIDVYDDAERISEKEFTFEAPETGTYLLVLSNTSHDEIDVAVEATVSGSEGREHV